jgi:hypothetical protein
METVEPATREHAVPAPSAVASDSAADFALTPPHNPARCA